jgi:hypothetical protein
MEENEGVGVGAGDVDGRRFLRLLPRVPRSRTILTRLAGKSGEGILR